MAKPKIEPRLPKGMRDFLPPQMIRREYVFGVIREVFHLYGFEPLQTPVLEMRETLMGKYGEDAEKLIFNAQHPGGKEELALRYDLTVPLARVVAQYPNEIALPFKRYQISPVWRAERPQKGRYREFYQCDADIAGAPNMSADAEIVGVVVTALRRLGFRNFTVKLNNRKLLTAIGQYAGVEGEALAQLYRSIDKFDKVGADGVRAELAERGLPADVSEKIMALILLEGDDAHKLDVLTDTMGHLPAAQEAISELRDLLGYLEASGLPREHYAFDFTMVRGLGYYTGPIFEAVAHDAGMGSIMGGGRYDELVGLFRGENIPTVGMAFGIERIIDLMETFNLYPPELGGTNTQVLVTVFSPATRRAASGLAAELRAGGLRTELYMQDRKLGAQIGYADKKGIPLVALLGEEEIASGTVKLKRLRDGQEVSVARADAAAAAQNLLKT
jgi:histidyl-tRNA synthetase